MTSGPLTDGLPGWMNYTRKGAPLPSPEIAISVAAGMTAALTWRNPVHPDIQKWVDKALSLSKNQPEHRSPHAGVYQ